MPFEDHLIKLSKDKINELAREYANINNVVIGINRNCYSIAFDDKKSIFYFSYVGWHEELEGWIFKIKFKIDHFYEFIAAFAYVICQDKENMDMVDIYNTYIKQMRSVLEQSGIITVTNAEYKKLQHEYRDPNPLIISKSPIEAVLLLDKSEFYNQLLGIKTEHTFTDGKNHVYIILNPRTNLFKIGRSKNPLKREKTLQSEEPDIILLKAWEADAPFETYLHKKFQNKRHRGEWFKLSLRDLLEINEMKCGYDKGNC